MLLLSACIARGESREDASPLRSADTEHPRLTSPEILQRVRETLGSRALPYPHREQRPSETPPPLPLRSRWHDDRTLVVGPDTSGMEYPGWSPETRRLARDIASASGVLIDLRTFGAYRPHQTGERRLLGMLARRMIATSIQRPRQRMRETYRPMGNPVGRDTTVWVDLYGSGEWLRPAQPHVAAKHVAFLFDPQSELPSIAATLQHEGRGALISARRDDEPLVRHYFVMVANDMATGARSEDVVNEDGTPAFHADTTLAVATSESEYNAQFAAALNWTLRWASRDSAPRMAAAAPRAADLIGPTNDEVEYLPSQWSSSRNGWLVGAEVDRYTKRSGDASAHLWGRGGPGSSVWLGQSIRADEYAGRCVRLTIYMRTHAVEEFALPWVKADGDGVNLSLDCAADSPLVGTTDWTKREIIFDVPPGSAGISFGAILLGPGEAWIDDVAFETVPSRAPRLTLVPHADDVSVEDATEQARSYVPWPRRPACLGFETR